ncbi:MAG: glycosyltransferase family 4 protein [Chloroflexi bacterium]|nr:glycosyltransferase family 4 protein [Chloroflexota bacterium]
MRVHIVNSNLEGMDAVGRYMLDQWRFFRARGDDVRLNLTSPPHHVPDELAEHATVGATGGPANYAAMFNGADLLIFHYSIVYPLIESIGAACSVLCFHNITPPGLWQGAAYDREALQRSIDRAAQLADRADLIVTPSAYNAAQLAARYGVAPDRIRVIPFVIDPAVYCPGSADRALRTRYGLNGRKVILFVGRMASNKRVDLLLEALALVRKHVPEAALLLVGDQQSPALAPYVAQVHERVSDLGLQQDVVFAGLTDELPAHYRLASVYATASEHEGFGVPLVEAMASGVPVVASDAAAHSEVVDAAGLLCVSNDASAMADVLVRVLCEPALHADLSRRGLARAMSFSRERHDAAWERIAGEAALLAGSAQRRRYGAATVSGTHERIAINADLQRLEAMADIMLRDYRIESRVPVVGAFIAWVRRNLTSHLREPYIDPVLERQVTFNRQILLSLIRLLRWQDSLRASGAPVPGDIEQRLARLEAQIETLSAQIESGLHGEPGRS